MTAWIDSVRLTTTEELPTDPSGTPATPTAIDGVPVDKQDRILVKDQTDSRQCGIWIAGQGGAEMTRAEDAIGRASTFRVREGQRNAHTQWSVADLAGNNPGALQLRLLQQATQHHSAATIGDLGSLHDVAPGATATVAGYADPADRGGGTFTFLGLPGSARVVSAQPVVRPITALAEVGGMVSVTAPGHGLGTPNNISMAHLAGIAGVPDGPQFVTVVDANTFIINRAIPGAGPAQVNAKVHYVRVQTVSAHGRATGQRVSVAGLAPVAGAVDIRGNPDDAGVGMTDLAGVIDEQTLSIPIPGTGGSYAPGVCAVVGDIGITVPAVDPEGVRGGLWQRLRADHIDVRWFGAKVVDPVAGTKSDNLPAFTAALAALAAQRQTGRLVADGHFFFADTLTLRQTVLLEGAGQNEPVAVGGARCAPGTLFEFPKDVTGIRIHGMAPFDYPHEPELNPPNPNMPSAEKSVLRDLTIWCNDQEGTVRGHGMHISTQVRLENITIENFAENGINIAAATYTREVEPGIIWSNGNADISLLENCAVGGCGGYGFHLEGGDVNACLISRCSAVVNRGGGFFDYTFGNTYLQCHSEANLGPNYVTKLDSNASTFVSCWSEIGSPPSIFRGQPTIIGGSCYMTPDSSAFVLSHGVASQSPLVYTNRRGTRTISASFGDGTETIQGPSNNMVALNLATLNDGNNPDDSTWLHYVEAGRGSQWWALSNNSMAYGNVMRLPTGRSNARYVAPWFPRGVYIGRDDFGAADDPPKAHFTAAPTLPVTRYDSSNGALTYERGDVVWNSEPVLGRPVGQICIASGTTWFPGAELQAGYCRGDTAAGSDIVPLTNLNGGDPLADLAVGQYLSIDGLGTSRRVVALDTAARAVKIDPPADAGVIHGLVTFARPLHATFGTVGEPGASAACAADSVLTAADRYVTVTADLLTITLPAAPYDGQAHSIKCQTALTQVTVATFNGALTIDGAPSVVVTSPNSVLVRYNAATTEWEIR
jgi:hypothetical protein